MAKVLTFEIPEKEYNEFKEFLEMAVVEMRQSREKMRADQIEIDRIAGEIEQIKVETAEIKAKSDVVLNELIVRHLRAA